MFFFNPFCTNVSISLNLFEYSLVFATEHTKALKYMGTLTRTRLRYVIYFNYDCHVNVSDTLKKSVEVLRKTIQECLETLDELAAVLIETHREEIFNLLLIKNGYKVKIREVGKRRMDRIIKDSVKRKLTHERLYELSDKTWLIENIGKNWK